MVISSNGILRNAGKKSGLKEQREKSEKNDLSGREKCYLEVCFFGGDQIY